ncbi:MAG: (5-formylfuran-3-yl)methyl phosphate synthase [Candidatus Helarchaeota archaeon]
MKLLVSPFTVEEAKIAIKGQADIIDVKNPEEGSLGANFSWVIRPIEQLVHQNNHQKLSATIGDVPDLPGTAALAALGAATCNVDYIKVGLKGPQTQDAAIKLMKTVIRTVKEYNASVQVVVAGYADSERFHTLNPLLLPEIARQADANVVMVDTGMKDGKNLFDFLSMSKLQEFLDGAREAGIQTALAGSIGAIHVPALQQLRPDIIGVRGAVCENNDRLKGRMRLSKIVELKKLISTGA